MKNINGHGRELVKHEWIATREELDALIDREARRLLGVSGERFMSLRAERKLPERVGVRPLAMLADLGSLS